MPGTYLSAACINAKNILPTIHNNITLLLGFISVKVMDKRENNKVHTAPFLSFQLFFRKKISQIAK